ETIEKEFGSEILFLIEGVTKLGKLKYRGAERHTESLRKLFVSMAEDIRVLIIKLTDRLHNMQTLEFVPAHKQKRIALETLEIYAPLAYRLGIRRLNRELEDLAFKYVYPDGYKKVEALIEERSEKSQDRLEDILKDIKKNLAKEGLTKFRSDYRIKGLYSLYKKLERKEWDIEKVYDIAAVRIFVETVADCYKALGAVHASRRPLVGRIKDYIAVPKPNGYRSLHTTVFTGDGGIVEIQIRTEEMHREAEFGIASHLAYKGSMEKISLSPNLIWLRNLLPYQRPVSFSKDKRKAIKFTDVPHWIKQMADAQQAARPEDFTKNLKSDFFGHRIFVFTPHGDVVDLPIDSSPIDFAYAIHSDIGDHASGAKVNGKMVSFDTKLKNGDIVEIVVKKNAHPTAKWLEFAKTTMAKKHIQTRISPAPKK
ncbi:MAG: HD domain-containing protein, partial [Patescibacteria group bacterium]